jgi:hypothetical protein
LICILLEVSWRISIGGRFPNVKIIYQWFIAVEGNLLILMEFWIKSTFTWRNLQLDSNRSLKPISAESRKHRNQQFQNQYQSTGSLPQEWKTSLDP